MSDAIGSFVKRALAAAALVVAAVLPAAAQQMEPLSEFPATAQFLPRFDFTLSAAALGNKDPRFSWDTRWGGNFDLVDYKYGRMTFVTDYQGLLGREFRPFDPYQSNYTLEAMGSVRAGKTEIFAILNHVSRHLGDRPKPEAVAENSLGVRLLRRFEDGSKTFDVRIDLRKVVATAYDDYSVMGDVDTTLRIHVRGRTTVFGRIYAEGVTVDPTVANRNNQYGGRVEAGVRIRGEGGVLELFAGTERMLDADPLDRMVATWPLLGFRIRAH
jgi:hypothetical protein